MLDSPSPSVDYPRRCKNTLSSWSAPLDRRNVNAAFARMSGPGDEAEMPHDTLIACMLEHSTTAHNLRGAAVVIVFADHG